MEFHKCGNCSNRTRSIFSFFYDGQTAEKKELAFQVLVNIPIFSTPSNIREKFNKAYTEAELSNLSIIQYKIQNTGQVTIAPDDYIKPIQINLSPNANILEFRPISWEPSNLGMSATQISQSTIEFTKTLLNSGDYFIGKIIASDNDGSLQPQARIIDITSIKVISDTTVRINLSPLAMYSIVAIILTGVTAALFMSIFSFSPLFGWISAVSLVTFSLFGYDKTLAWKQGFRIPELILLLLSVVGGSIGALFGMYIFNHKTPLKKGITK